MKNSSVDKIVLDSLLYIKFKNLNKMNILEQGSNIKFEISGFVPALTWKGGFLWNGIYSWKREERDALFLIDLENFSTRKLKREQKSTQKQFHTTLMLSYLWRGMWLSKGTIDDNTYTFYLLKNLNA